LTLAGTYANIILMKSILLALCITALSTNALAGRGHKQQVPPAFSTKSYIIANENGTVLKEQDGTTVRPIASISKLMVGLLVSEQNLAEQLSIPSKRYVNSSIPRKTSTMSRMELLTLALVRSDNFAAQILCANIPSCIDNMNARAKELGMDNTLFVEPTGLDSRNVSTAQDLLRLLLVASTNQVLSSVSRQPYANIVVMHNTVHVNNTNPLTAKLDILLSKTGFTNPAGGCIVMMLNSAVGKRFYILLGSKNAHTRIPDMERLVKEL
jgi:D-alanyl-D-alanine endopeptidase (penicillin-binding protein 7)